MDPVTPGQLVGQHILAQQRFRDTGAK